jgi:protein-S-isoprenylcysteine O-methyltransferase Ste14
MSLLQLALGFILNGWVPLLFAVVLMLILHFGVILREESYLEAKFGQHRSHSDEKTGAKL